MRTQSGFTLIELMIVIAIVGILATFSISAYQSYVARSQAGEAFVLATAQKKVVGDIYLDEGTFVNAANGYLSVPQPAEMKGHYTTLINITAGVIVAELGVDASAAIAGTTIALEPTVLGGSIIWACRYSGDSKFAPKACR
jgi:type IV pilus assembly protein PilA